MRAVTALNGQLPGSMLAYIGNGVFRLRVDAAASYLRMRSAGCPAGVTTAYRTLAQQQYLLNLYGYPHAQYPGQSQHGEGLALDLPDAAEAWVRAHGAAYGWRFTIKAEAWHCEYFPNEDTKANSTTTEDDMPTAEEIAAAVWAFQISGPGGPGGAPAKDRADAWLRDARVDAQPFRHADAIWDAKITGSPDGDVTIWTDEARNWLRDTRLDAHRAANAPTSAAPAVDVNALAKALAPLVHAGLTEEQVVAAVRSVFADAGQAPA